jgi:hypothetical protein
MDEYPGISSYPYLLSGENSIPARSIPRDRVLPLVNPTSPQGENKKLSLYFQSEEFQEISISLSPEELRLAFPSTKDSAPELFRQELLNTRQGYKVIYANNRAGKPTLGVMKLISGSMLDLRKPPTAGKKMVCLSTYKELRQIFISAFKRLRSHCRLTFQRWQDGHTRIPYPPGMFAPHLPRLSNFIPQSGL